MAAVRHFNFSETALPMVGAAGGGCAVPETQCKSAMSALTTPVSSGGMGLQQQLYREFGPGVFRPCKGHHSGPPSARKVGRLDGLYQWNRANSAATIFDTVVG